jgi:hypothetical protein
MKLPHRRQLLHLAAGGLQALSRSDPGVGLGKSMKRRLA